MAFSFFGTFTTGQWDALREFGLIQKADLQARKDWLSKQLTSNGVFSTEYNDDGTPVETRDDGTPGFQANAGSYGAKLLDAYRMLGGIPEHDMLLRTRDDAVYLTGGTNLATGGGDASHGFSDLFSNGRRNRGTMRFDRDLGIRTDRFKKWQLEGVKQKRERLEYKIKRCLDCSHQIQDEIDLLTALLGDGPGSVDDLISKVEVQMFADGVMSVIDNPGDKFGLGIGRPGDLTYADALDEADAGEERVP